MAIGSWAVAVAVGENNVSAFSLLAVHIHMAKVTAAVAEEDQFLCDKERAVGEGERRMWRELGS